jgi:hypothetical protein
MSYKHLMLLLGLSMVALGLTRGLWGIPLAWLGLNFAVLGVAYWRHNHRVFGKTPQGRLPFWSRLLFLPLLVYHWLVWHLLRLLSREPAYSRVTDKLVLSRRVLPFELDEVFENYVDLTAEFAEPSAIRKRPGYRCFPLLDGSAPTPEALAEAVKSLPPGRTFVHCAQGHGRSGLFGLAFLLVSRVTRTLDEGLEMLQAARPGVRLSRDQRRCIEAVARQLR